MPDLPIFDRASSYSLPHVWTPLPRDPSICHSVATPARHPRTDIPTSITSLLHISEDISNQAELPIPPVTIYCSLSSSPLFQSISPFPFIFIIPLFILHLVLCPPLSPRPCLSFSDSAIVFYIFFFVISCIKAHIYCLQ